MNKFILIVVVLALISIASSRNLKSKKKNPDGIQIEVTFGDEPQGETQAINNENQGNGGGIVKNGLENNNENINQNVEKHNGADIAKNVIQHNLNKHLVQSPNNEENVSGQEIAKNEIQHNQNLSPLPKHDEKQNGATVAQNQIPHNQNLVKGPNNDVENENEEEHELTEVKNLFEGPKN